MSNPTSATSLLDPLLPTSSARLATLPHPSSTTREARRAFAALLDEDDLVNNPYCRDLEAELDKLAEDYEALRQDLHKRSERDRDDVGSSSSVAGSLLHGVKKPSTSTSKKAQYRTLQEWSNLGAKAIQQEVADAGRSCTIDDLRSIMFKHRKFPSRLINSKGNWDGSVPKATVIAEFNSLMR
ncbi:hypothetical protein JCM10212_001471 [Sporobolomyces blumeae]